MGLPPDSTLAITEVILAVVGGAFALVLSALGTLGLLLLKGIREDMQKMSDAISTVGQSVCDLNTKVAVVIERVDSHEHRLVKVEDAVRP